MITCFSQDLVEDFMCACPPGFTGKNCSVEINECFPNNSCPGNSTCIDELDSYSCTCNTGFEGDNCTGIAEQSLVRSFL